MLFPSQVPDGITHVVSDKHGATLVDDDAHRSSFCLAAFIQKPCQKRVRHAPCLTGLGYFDCNHLVTTWRVTVPRATLGNDGVMFEPRDGGA